ncbi:MAG TPA: fused MFS/spermidine synthase [Gammaproteobacteria bacterium]|nr:fused MFS/spermidine synthase [Gammaproteobacteria bacterium]
MKRTLTLLICAALLAGPAQAARIIYQKPSLYQNVTVTDDGSRICMQFASRGRFYSQQSCQFKDDPDRLVFEYARLAFAGLMINPEPSRVLVVGLGGGSIPRTFRELFPEAKIDTVEIDPAVVEVAERYFDFEDDENLDIIVKDARVFVKQAGIMKRKYDYIVLDAFNGDYIPEHLMTKEWLEEVKAVLADGGVLIANTFSISDLYDNESATYESAFGWIRNVKLDTGNRLILTGNFEPVSKEDMLARAERLDSERFEPYGFTLRWIAENVHDEADWDRSARVLTDQYAPANLLQGRKSGD